MTDLTSDQKRTFSALLDTLIPPGPGGLPGAGALGLGERVSGEVAKQPGALASLAAGLEALDAVARRGEAEGFTALSPEARAEALQAHAESDPGFLPGLIFLTYVAYYQHGRVMQALGLEPRPPHPKGYEMAPSDLGELTRSVAARPPIWRNT